jgi:hypothetical protein
MPRFESSDAQRSLSFLAIACILVLIGTTATATAEEPGWFPRQAAPRSIARTVRDDRFPEPHLALSMMVQSVAGLAARAVNEGRGDEMVWVATSNPDVERWYTGWLARNPSIVVHQGEFTPWDLVDRYRERGVVKGYILYHLDRSAGEINEHRMGMDLSVNVASSMAGLLDGILIDESLEAEAKAHGLSLLLDAREKSQQWCFETYKDRFNRRMLCTQDPRKTNIRDLAIAQQALMIYGNGEPLGEVLKWLEPPAPIMGWNGGDEFKTTLASTIQGHFQTATDWCVNLPVLMAGSVAMEPPGRAKRLDPRGIGWNDRRSAVSFVSTDGDNVQWLEGNFFASQSY